MKIRAMPGGVANGRPLLSRPYRYKGEDGWDPNDLGPIPKEHGQNSLQREREERLAQFTGYRAEGWTVDEAGELLGVSPETARAYERDRLQKRAQS